MHWDRFGRATLISVVCVAVAWVMDPLLSEANLVMLFLLGAAVSGLRHGRGPSVLTAVLNILCFNFLFIEPRFTFEVANAEYIVTFVVMLIVALTIATLMANVRQQTRVTGARERRTSLLYGMSRELAGTRGAERMARVAVKHVGETFQSRAAVLLPDADGTLRAES